VGTSEVHHTAIAVMFKLFMYPAALMRISGFEIDLFSKMYLILHSIRLRRQTNYGQLQKFAI